MAGLYNYKWQKERRKFLKVNDICIKCGSEATVVDHIEPHKGDLDKFWDKDNWQPMCKRCHDSYKKRLERSGRVLGCTNDGIPIDPNHHWNKGWGG